MKNKSFLAFSFGQYVERRQKRIEYKSRESSTSIDEEHMVQATDRLFNDHRFKDIIKNVPESFPRSLGFALCRLPFVLVVRKFFNL